MTIQLTIPDKLPCLNDLIYAERTHRQKGAALKKDTEGYIRTVIRQQLWGIRLKPPVSLHYHFYEPNRRRDKDGIAAFAMKVIQDSLVKEELLNDDGWAYISGFTCEFSVDPAHPRVEVIIKEG